MFKMPYYKKIIKSGNMLEIEVYKSIRRRNLKNISRSAKQAETPEKKKEINKINACKNLQRLICNNFNVGDWFLALTFDADLTEQQANREYNNFIARLNYYYKKTHKENIKYVGVIEKGKQGHKWHGHIILPKLPSEDIIRIWKKGNYAGRILFEPLYADGNYKKLAEYIRKDCNGQKRIKHSRGNLVPPKITVREVSKKDLRKIHNGEIIDTPKNYTLNVDESQNKYNDLTGTSLYLVYTRFKFFKR